MARILYENKEAKEKVLSLRSAGPSRLLVISDFDGTLTQALPGQAGLSLIAALREHALLGPDYAAKARALAEEYGPAENDASLSEAERSERMAKWWQEHYQLLFSSGLSQEKIVESVSLCGRIFRPGVSGFFRRLEKAGVPLLVFSASGLGAAGIEEFFRQQGEEMDGIFLAANRFRFDDKGRAVGLSGPLIHSASKSREALQQMPFFSKLSGRDHIVILGNSLDDADMVEGLGKEILKIGIWNGADPCPPAFRSRYDLVIPGDGAFEVIGGIIKDIIG